MTTQTPDEKQAPPAPARRSAEYNRLSSCPDMEPEFIDIYRKAKPFTMTTLERMYALYKAVEHIDRHDIRGDIVECGVWKGGSAMVCALSLQRRAADRRIWLYDTFEGMTQPTGKDVQYDGLHAEQRMRASDIHEPGQWCNAPLEEVRRNMRSTGYPEDRLVFVRGPVERTLPDRIPDRIALLRLDTDWYESTRHELVHLFPRLVPGGVIVIDDYGHWKGCREAVDEYFEEHRIPVLLQRIDYTGRIGIKP